MLNHVGMMGGLTNAVHSIYRIRLRLLPTFLPYILATVCLTPLFEEGRQPHCVITVLFIIAGS